MPVEAGLSGIFGCSPGLRTKAAEAVFAMPLSWVPCCAAHWGTRTVRRPPSGARRTVVAPGVAMLAPVAGALHGVTTTVRGRSAGTTTARKLPPAMKVLGGLVFFEPPTAAPIPRMTISATITPATVRLPPNIAVLLAARRRRGARRLHQAGRRRPRARLGRRLQDVALARALLAARRARRRHARRDDDRPHVAVVGQDDLVDLLLAAAGAARAAGALRGLRARGAARRH